MSGVQQYDRAALFPEIVERLSAGEPLAKICRDERMPSRRTVYLWLESDESAKAEFEVARDDGFDSIAARLRDTARGAGDSAGDVQRDKLIIETDLKLLAKWDPRRYGDKVQTEHSGNVTLTHEQFLATLE